MTDESRHAPDDAKERRDTLGRIWEQQQSHLYAFCLSWMSGDAEQARDVLCRLAIKVLENSPAWIGSIENHTAWLTRLARNMCVDAQRQQGSYRRAIERLTSGADLANATTGEHPEKERLRVELAEQILSTLEALPPDLREPSRLRFLEYMAHEEIAAELGLSNETVRKRIQQARSILQRNLECYLREGIPVAKP